MELELGRTDLENSNAATGSMAKSRSVSWSHQALCVARPDAVSYVPRYARNQSDASHPAEVGPQIDSFVYLRPR